MAMSAAKLGPDHPRRAEAGRQFDPFAAGHHRDIGQRVVLEGLPELLQWNGQQERFGLVEIAQTRCD